MSNPNEALPFGLWPSPITPQSMAQGRRLTEVAWDSDGQTLVWLEGRSDRNVIVCAGPGDDAPRDLTAELSPRGGVGYGGGELTVCAGHVYFVERGGRIYRQPLAFGPARPITPAFGNASSPVVSQAGRWLVYVHSYEGVDRLAIVDAEGHFWPQHIVSGADFYMQPRFHPQGTYLAWISWSHPRMPWDGTELYVGRLRYGNGLPWLDDVRLVAGGPDTAIFQPEFSPDGQSLAYISDESGWGNLYLYDLEAGERLQLTTEQAELGGAAWVQGMRTYGFRHDGRAIYVLRNSQGARSLCRYELDTGELKPAGKALAGYGWLKQLTVAPDRDALALLASAPTIPERIVTLDPVDGERARVRARIEGETIPPSQLSPGKAISWTTSNGALCHGIYYAPTGGHAPAGLPPAIIHIHGGPTSQAMTNYDPMIQFFTTRGYAVLSVNHRGSTGYGREYMLAQRGQWGVVDVEDAVSGTHYLTRAGLADSSRMVIAGGSAGGYTVLQSLVMHPGVFKAGLCWYGISNLITSADTHKFESRYNDGLLGVLPEAYDVYRERSPLFHVERIQDPVALFHGTEDNVVPRDQSDTIVASLRRRGVPHEYHVYEGEGHGFRKSETIRHFYGALESFLKQYVIYG